MLSRRGPRRSLVVRAVGVEMSFLLAFQEFDPGAAAFEIRRHFVSLWTRTPQYSAGISNKWAARPATPPVHVP